MIFFIIVDTILGILGKALELPTSKGLGLGFKVFCVFLKIYGRYRAQPWKIKWNTKYLKWVYTVGYRILGKACDTAANPKPQTLSHRDYYNSDPCPQSPLQLPGNLGVRLRG